MWYNVENWENAGSAATGRVPGISARPPQWGTGAKGYFMKILHTGDLHLDSAFHSLSERQAEIRKNELRAAFTSMMTYARMNDVSMALFAGDVFDSAYATRETLHLLAAEFARFGRPIVIATGNHDPSCSLWNGVEFPDNVTIFTKPEMECVTFPELNCEVWGYGFDTPNLDVSPLEGFRLPAPADGDENRIRLVVCHADTLDKDSTNAPLSEKALQDCGADYIALGHIHNAPPMGEKWAYCGCLEGRKFTEPGPKGACIAEIHKENGTAEVRVRRVRFSKRRYESVELPVDGIHTQAEAAKKIAAWIMEKKLGEDALLRVTLTGQVDPALVLQPELFDSCGLFSLTVVDGTTPEIDPAVLQADPGIRGAFYRALAPRLHSNDPGERASAVVALRAGLSAIDGGSIG